MHWSWIGVKGRIELSDKGTRSAEADILHSLFEKMRPPDEVTPSPGFYERVLSRIERIERQSIWVPFIHSPFPARAATAFLGLSLAALGYVVAAERNINDAPYIMNGGGSDPILSPTNVQQQRNAVLMQIVTYRKPN